MFDTWSILTLLRGFQGIPLYLVVVFKYPSLFWHLRDKKRNNNSVHYQWNLHLIGIVLKLSNFLKSSISNLIYRQYDYILVQSGNNFDWGLAQFYLRIFFIQFIAEHYEHVTTYPIINDIFSRAVNKLRVNCNLDLHSHNLMRELYSVQ